MNYEQTAQRLVELREQYDLADPTQRAMLQPELQQIQDQLAALQGNLTQAQTAAQAAQLGTTEGAAEAVETIDNLSTLNEIHLAGMVDAGRLAQVVAAFLNHADLPPQDPSVHYLEPPTQIHEQAPQTPHQTPSDNEISANWAALNAQKEKSELTREQRDPLAEGTNKEPTHENSTTGETSDRSAHDKEADKLINEFQQHVENGCVAQSLKDSVIHAAEKLYNHFERIEQIPQVLASAFQHAKQEKHLEHVKEMVAHQIETHYGSRQRDAFEHVYTQHTTQIQQQQQHQQHQHHTVDHSHDHGHSHSSGHTHSGGHSH